MKILVLEDDLETLSYIMKVLYEIEEGLLASDDPKDIAATTFAEYSQVLDYLNITKDNNFDLIILDRDCKAGGSFHCLDFGKYDPKKVIAISTNKEYNDEVEALGIGHTIMKDYQSLEDWSVLLKRLVLPVMCKLTIKKMIETMVPDRKLSLYKSKMIVQIIFQNHHHHSIAMQFQPLKISLAHHQLLASHVLLT